MPAALLPSEEQEICSLRDQGLSARAIAQATGRSLSSVGRVLRQSTLSTRRLGPWDHLPPTVQAEIRECYAKGYSVEYLRKTHGVGQKRLLKELADIPLPCAYLTGIERLRYLSAAVLQEYAAGAGCRDLSKRFGVHEGTMRTFLQCEGVLRSRGGLTGEQNRQSKGNQTSSKERDSGKYWSRRVCELALGQKLPEGVVIHHMNQNPTDQTLSNLWLFPSAQAHSTFHQQLRDSLSLGGQLLPSRLALDSGGLWLPEIVGRLQSQPSTEPLDLFCKQQMQPLGQTS